ncbi:MAG: hypothetical protein P9X24_15105 [Candidatus Hatepunaea meridiana]|nr:hypothetical protein [Candidatus Hatepunaea meridiana]
MEQWIEFAKGPLFTLTFLIMVLGLLRLIIPQVYLLFIRKRDVLRDVKWSKIIKDTLSWIIPIKHFISGTRLFSLASYIMHIGVIIVPICIIDHIVLWEKFFNINLPSIGQGLADYLTLITIACLLILLGCRTFKKHQRAMSGFMDYFLLIMVILPFASGYLASHPNYNPFPWDVMMLTHLLSAELLFVLIPFSKLAHIILFNFDRTSGVHWQLRPGAGDKIAEALFGKGVKI